MLTFNPRNIFLLRGIEKTTRFLVNLGMDYSTASRFLKSQSQFVKINDIEKLCVALNCTPNDLFEWKTDNKTILPETHSLNALNRGDKVEKFRQAMKNLPTEKLIEIENLLTEQKN